MNICLLGSSFLPRIGGMELAMHHLANSLVNLGNNVTIFVQNIDDNFIYLPKKYEIVRYGFNFPLSGRSGADYCSGIFKFYNTLKSKKIDVVHCHDVYAAGRIARFFKSKFNFKLVMTPHGEAVRVEPEFNYGLLLNNKAKKIIIKNLDEADCVTAISKSIQKDVELISQNKIYCVPNGINVNLYKTNKSKFLHQKIKVKQDTKILISVGRNHAIKGYAYGIKAFSALLKKGVSDMAYVLIGKNTHTLNPMINDLGLQKKIFVIPEQNFDAIRRCYRSAWAFFSPSISEGLSLVSLEAMASGLPLVMTNASGNEDVVLENDCGIIVEKKDYNSMANGIFELYNENKLYNKFSNNAFVNSKKYDWDLIASKYIDVFNRI
ncbi:glycosyltransferase family 4 protein [Desulfoplanes formicivorans]|uniref:Glycosyltransferase n=1 Tax=Desulfoplanes formicivorans TaxID=1592317 RepID=A0A194AF10_9BACT|nr:glycosyltransferase family 4 protein [Desulfoplanes formicivorans]GAU07369.1 hypothetical protein DPF_0047 [Desulfoplanes formicivorans]